MFAIKSGSMFVSDRVRAGTVALSSQPILFTTRRKAEDAFEVINNEGGQLMQRYTELADREEAQLAKSKKTIERLEKVLAELYLLPFGQVEKKVERTRKSIEDSMFYVTNNSIKSYRQTAARLKKILDTMKIVSVETVDIEAA
jgi:hypothetical protein